MGSRTEEMLKKIMPLHDKGWTKRKISIECRVSPQYVGKLIKLHEQIQHRSMARNYGLSTRILNCLNRNHIPVDVHALADSIDKLLCMRGIGTGSLIEIGAVLEKLNIIDDTDEWVEEGKRRLYFQRKDSLQMYRYDQPGYDRPTMAI